MVSVDDTLVLTGADGAVGVKAIKSEGGFTIAQTIDSAQHSSMPHHAIETGAVDRQLTIEAMPDAIVDYIGHSGFAPPPDWQAQAQAESVSLAAILETLRMQVGIDFRSFKTPMLSRRVHRRMGLARLGDMARYADTVANAVDRAEKVAKGSPFGLSLSKA